MNVPDDLRYSTDHEWIRRDGNLVRIGVTDYAQDSLGDVVFVDLPAMGTTVNRGEAIGEIESTKAVSELYAPVSGEVVEVNEALRDSPDLLNRDPYGAGWWCVIRASSSDDDTLLDPAAYRSLTGS